jgi:hypothetical protein
MKRLIEDYAIRDGIGPIVRKEGALKETKERNNGLTLGSGNHIAMTLEKPATTIHSSPDALIRAQTSSQSSSIVYGATYECSGDTPAVVVQSSGRLILIGCHFTKTANTQSATGSYIRVESGGALSVIGCYFHNAQAAGFTIDNASLLARVQAIGCIRETTAAAPHNNVTPIGEVVL